MSLRILRLAAGAAMAMSLSAAAGAATIFNFSFTAPWVLSTQTGSGSGQLFANDLGNGSYQVIGVTGTARTSATASAIALDTVSAPVLSTPTITGNATGGYFFNGILSGSGGSYNFAKNALDTTNYTISSGLRTTGAGTFSLALAPVSAAVPEVGTWVMMIIGFGAVGAMLRSGKRRNLAHGERINAG